MVKNGASKSTLLKLLQGMTSPLPNLTVRFLFATTFINRRRHHCFRAVIGSRIIDINEKKPIFFKKKWAFFNCFFNINHGLNVERAAPASNKARERNRCPLVNIYIQASSV
jgi:hypothetical protein